MIPEQREQILCASLLDSPLTKWGPNVSTALAYAPRFWHSPEAAKVAEAIVTVHIHHLMVPSRSMIKAHMREYQDWLNHPAFSDPNGIPASCLESLAAPLLPLYRNKQIYGAIGDAWSKVQTKPGNALEIAEALHTQLGQWV